MTTKLSALHEELTPWATKEQVAAYEEAVAQAQEDQFPDLDIWDGPTDEELVARGSMPAPVEQDDAALLELMEKKAKEAGEYPDWYYDGESYSPSEPTSYSWWKPAPEEDISNLGWDEAGGAYIDD